MAVLLFPANPSVNDSYTQNGITYTWDGQKWTSSGSAGEDSFVLISGDNMTGDLTLGTDKIVLDATTGAGTFAGDIQSTSQNTGQLAGFRNQIINGAMLINQRDNSNLSVNGEYCPDRWINVGTTTLGLNRLTTDGFVGVGLQPVSGTGIVRQAIELPKPSNLGGNVLEPYSPFQPNSVWTLSVYADDASPGLVNDKLQYADNAGGDNALDAATGAGWVAKGGGRYSNTYTFNGSTPATNHNCLIFQLQWTSGRIGGVQLEPGPVATPFENIPIGTELALCQRYYQYYDGIILYNYSTVDTTRAYRSPREVTMRTDPTSTAAGANGTIIIGAGESENVIHIAASSISNLTSSIAVNYTADAEL